MFCIRCIVRYHIYVHSVFRIRQLGDYIDDRPSTHPLTFHSDEEWRWEVVRVHTSRIYEIMYSFFLFCIFPISFWLPFYYILLLLLWSKWLTEAMWHTCRRATMKNMHMNAPVLSTVDKGLHSAQCRRVEHIVHSACILLGEVSMQIPSTQFVVYLLCWHEYLY